MIVEFIDQHRGVFGVEPICAALSEHGCAIAPSTYYAARSRPLSARRQRDLVMMPILLALWVANFRVYGARKLWLAARRAGHDIGRDQVARLMRELGVGGVRRGRRVFTTRRDDTAADRPADLVRRDFTASRPNDLWVTDLTYVSTWAGVAYVCFIVDAFSRRIVGWSVAAHMRTEMILDAVQMAAWQRGARLDGLRCHSDAGSQFTSIRYGEHLAELGAGGSIGSVGDSYDNALAETVNGLYKAECIYGPDQGPWRTVGDVELATLAWVHWWNQQRLHGYLGDVPPAEFEATFYAAQQTDPMELEPNRPSLHQNQCGSWCCSGPSGSLLSRRSVVATLAAATFKSRMVTLLGRRRVSATQTLRQQAPTRPQRHRQRPHRRTQALHRV